MNTNNAKTENKPVLNIIQADGCWAVDFAGTPEADEIRELFGATQVPTPFGLSFPYDSVRAFVQEKNPQYVVS